MLKFNLFLLILTFILMIVVQNVQASNEFAIITASKHFDTKNDYNENNPGWYLIHNNFITGLYKNSYNTATVFAGRVVTTNKHKLIRLSLAYGISYGYGWDNGYSDPAENGAKALPFILPTLSIGYMNFHIVGNAAAVSFSIDLIK